MSKQLEYRTEYREDRASAMTWKRWLEMGAGTEPEVVINSVTFHGDNIVSQTSFDGKDLNRKIAKFQVDGALITCHTSGFDYIAYPAVTIKH